MTVTATKHNLEITHGNVSVPVIWMIFSYWLLVKILCYKEKKKKKNITGVIFRNADYEISPTLNLTIQLHTETKWIQNCITGIHYQIINITWSTLQKIVNITDSELSPQLNLLHFRHCWAVGWDGRGWLDGWCGWQRLPKRTDWNPCICDLSQNCAPPGGSGVMDGLQRSRELSLWCYMHGWKFAVSRWNSVKACVIFTFLLASLIQGFFPLGDGFLPSWLVCHIVLGNCPNVVICWLFCEEKNRYVIYIIEDSWCLLLEAWLIKALIWSFNHIIKLL